MNIKKISAAGFVFFLMCFLCFSAGPGKDLRYSVHAALPDLIVNDFWVMNGTVHYILKNRGESEVPEGHETALYIDDEQVALQTVNTVIGGAGGTWQGSFVYAWECSGESDLIRVEADIWNFVAEGNEANNGLQKEVICDGTPPQIISGPSVTGITQSSALISWTTDEPANSAVLYGLSPAPHEKQVDDTALVIDHQVLLNNLETSATYYYQVKSADAQGNINLTEDHTFATLPVFLPDLVITNVFSDNGAVCFEMLNQGADIKGGDVPLIHSAALLVDGALISSPLEVPELKSMETFTGCFDYEWSCTGEDDEITVIADYYGNIIESDEDNNSLSDTWVCETGPLQIVSGPSVGSVTQNSVLISWETSKGANSRITYGSLSRTYSHEDRDEGMVKLHSMALNDLTPAATYHYRVFSADSEGAEVKSRDMTFMTASLPDITGPDVEINLPEICEGFVGITAVVSDDQGISKVVFFVDDEPVHTVFAPPYTMSLNSRKFPDGPHEFKAEAFDLAGNPGTDSRSSDILNVKDTTLPQVVITFPSGDEVVSGDVIVKATASDDNGLFSGTFYVDGEWAGNWFPQTPGVKKTTIEMPWYTAAESNAPHRIAFQVFDLDLNAGTGVQDVVVNNTAPPAPPDINVTRALVNHGHYMTVILNVANVGEAAAANLKISDPMQLYQPVSREDAHTKYQALFKPETMQWIMDIRHEEPLAGGASVKFMYDVVPVLVYPNHLDPILGGDRYTQATDVWYDDQYNTIYRKFPLAIKDGDYYINTLQSCDYLAVTGPRNLRLFNTQADTDALLSKMAELAILRQGALGYIDLEFTFDISYGLQWPLVVGDVSGIPRPELIVGDPESGLIHIYSSYPINPCFQGITTCYHLVWYFMKDLGTGLPGKLFHLGDSLSTCSSQGGSKRDIVHLNCNSDSLSVYSSFGATIMNFAVPAQEPYAGLASGNVTGDSRSEFLIADHVNDKVYVYNPNGTKYGEFDRVYDVFDGFAAGDVLGDDSEEIIMAGQSAKKVFVLSPAGAVLSSFTFLFEKGDRLAVGNAIASWKNDKKEIIIGKHKGRKIHILNAQGTLLKSFDSQFCYLGGLAVGNILDGFNDDILVGYSDENKIVFYNAEHVSGTRDVLQDLLRNLIHPDPLAKGPGTWKPGGAWSILLDNSWTFGGYLLIVGETEIVPAFGGRWYGAVLTSKGTKGFIADCTDLPYANTFDDEIHPELNTGRIIGNSAKELMKPIQAAIDQINGTSPRHFDRSDALVVNGYPAGFGGGSDSIDFKSEADANAGRLSAGGVCVIQQDNTKLPQLDIIATQFFASCKDKDVIFLAGHGNAGATSEIGNIDIMKQSNPFQNACPFVFASSCSTGTYSTGFGIAEAFFSRSASAYLGATEWGVCCPHSDYSKMFFDRWSAGKTLGSAVRETKNFIAGDKYGNYWNGIYHLYGDPKYGAEGPPSSSSHPEHVFAAKTLSRVSAHLEIAIPRFQIDHRDDLDHVSIPGGLILFDVGMPLVPYYRIMVHYPRNTRIQDVSLVEKTGMLTTSDLLLPDGYIAVAEAGADSQKPVYDKPVPEWYPEMDLQWSVIEGPSSTTLVLSLFPFRYNATTTDAEFFGNFSVAVETAISETRINALETDRHEYAPGEAVAILMELEHDGAAPVDIIVDSVIRMQGSGETIQALPLNTLHDLQGPAAYNMVWESAGFDDGCYAAEVEIRDAEGRNLDTRRVSFRVGIKSLEITDLGAVPAQFEIGEEIALSMSIANRGTSETSGTAVLIIKTSGGDILSEFRRDIPLLAAGETWEMGETWPTDGLARDTYTVIAYIACDGRTSSFQETSLIANKSSGLLYY